MQNKIVIYSMLLIYSLLPLGTEETADENRGSREVLASYIRESPK